MTNRRKRIALALTVVLAVCILTACGSNGEKESIADESAQVYFLNSDQGLDDIYQAIAASYTEETGVKVKIETLESVMYEATLRGEITTQEAPTIFLVHDPSDFTSWKTYCLDLSNSTLCSYLLDQGLAITEGNGVYGIPYDMEGYGILYNDAIMQQYFALPDKNVELSSAAEITNFDLLKAIVEDMEVNKDILGIQGVFASTSMAPENQWRWQAHLASVPFYYEFSESAEYKEPFLEGKAAKTITFQYADKYKNLFDLYTDHSIVTKDVLSGKTVDDSMVEFALGQVAMVQSGNWTWDQISGVEGTMINPEGMKYLPLYTGMLQDAQQGLCIGTQNYFVINSQVSQEKQNASIAFLEWLFASETGKEYVKDQLHFTTPFNTFEDDEKPQDPFAREIIRWMEKDDVKSIPLIYGCFPSQAFRVSFGQALQEYVQSSASWEKVVTSVIDTWSIERANAE